jgi:hypothetical protein
MSARSRSSSSESSMSLCSSISSNYSTSLLLMYLSTRTKPSDYFILCCILSLRIYYLYSYSYCILLMFLISSMESTAIAPSSTDYQSLISSPSLSKARFCSSLLLWRSDLLSSLKSMKDRLLVGSMSSSELHDRPMKRFRRASGPQLKRILIKQFYLSLSLL